MTISEYQFGVTLLMGLLTIIQFLILPIKNERHAVFENARWLLTNHSFLFAILAGIQKPWGDNKECFPEFTLLYANLMAVQRIHVISAAQRPATPVGMVSGATPLWNLCHDPDYQYSVGTRPAGR